MQQPPYERDNQPEQPRAPSFESLAPGIEFEAPASLIEARSAALEALAQRPQDPDFLRTVWIEYARVCEQIVDEKSASLTIRGRAELQIAMSIYEALIFYEAGDLERYAEELEDAETYARNNQFDEVASALQGQLYY